MQSFSKCCVELVSSAFFQKKKSLPYICQNTTRTDMPCKGIWRVKYLFLLKYVTKAFEATVAWKEWRWSFLILLLWRVVKTKNSHILSLPFRCLLGLAYSSALICKWAVCFPAGDTGPCPRNTEEMSCQESSLATSNGLWAAPRAKLVFCLKIKIPSLLVFPSSINVYIYLPC